MAVYYKFKSAKAFDSIPIEGQLISVANLKERIFESKHLGTGTDFDLMVSNAQTNEDYVEEAAMIPRNTSVLVRRIPGRPRKNTLTERDESKIVEHKAEGVAANSSMLDGDSSTTMKYPEESDWDEFGNDLYAIPEVIPTQSSNNPGVKNVSLSSKIDEDNKIKALIETPALDWSCQGQDGYSGGRGFGRGMGGRMTFGRGFGRGGFERKTPPVGYICRRCKVPGHFIQHCPTNGDPNYDIRKGKPPTGIPKSMLMATPDGSYTLPSGAVAVLKPNEAVFEKEIEGIPSTRPASELPPELRCPLCKEVMKDAVLTSKCCFRSFCDNCIRGYIIRKSVCVCGATNLLADDLLPNRTLRETIGRILESRTNSIENVGSMVQVQDMESARHVPPEIPITTFSAASKDELKQTHMDCSSDVRANDAKEADAASAGRNVNDMVHSLEKKTAVSTEPFEAAPGSMSAKESTSQQSAPMPESRQAKLLGGNKKNKKKNHLPNFATDVQWTGFQDFGAENYAGMPLAPSAYNPYWGGGMPIGIDGYMTTFGSAMPCMGYGPGPYDFPFGGILPPDPFAHHGFMMPALHPRDLTGFNSVSMNKGPPLSREELAAMKSNFRKKGDFERERIYEREHLRNRNGIRQEVSSSRVADASSTKAKPRLLSQAEQFDQPERASHLDRHHKSSRHSPQPPVPLANRRRSLEYDERKEQDKAAEERNSDNKRNKGSVFSRINFPEFEKEKKMQHKVLSSSSSTANNGIIKDDHHHPRPNHSHHSHQDVPSRHKAGPVTSNGITRSSYEHESSEDEEEEHHFKRRPSRREKEMEEKPMYSRESRGQDRGHERVEMKKRR